MLKRILEDRGLTGYPTRRDIVFYMQGLVLGVFAGTVIGIILANYVLTL